MAPTCQGSGSKILALELASHIWAENRKTSLIIDLSSGPSPFDFESNCLLAYLYNIIHASTALRRYDKLSSILITKAVTNKCKGMLKKKGKVLDLLVSKEFIESLVEMIQHLVYKDINVVVYFPPDALGQYLFKEIMVERDVVGKSSIVITTNERVHCLKSWPEHIEREDVKMKIRSIIINRIPMGVFDHVQEDAMKLIPSHVVTNGSLILSLIPLTMQLYYRDFNTYIPLIIKSEFNEHARSLSTLMKRIARALLGLEEERKLIAVVRGMISERTLASAIA